MLGKLHMTYKVHIRSKILVLFFKKNTNIKLYIIDTFEEHLNIKIAVWNMSDMLKNQRGLY